MKDLLIAIFDLLDSEKSKKELLSKAKEIQKLKIKAKSEALAMSEDAQDEFALDFGDKLFEILRKNSNVSNN